MVLWTFFEKNLHKNPNDSNYKFERYLDKYHINALYLRELH